MPAVSHLRSLQALEAAVRGGSLVAAAGELGISPAAVGQRIKALEAYLGAELVLRGRAGIQPSQALAEALPHLAAGFGELARAAAALEMQRGHELHVVGPPDFLVLWLKPRLPAFARRLPAIRFSLNGEGDASLRIGRADCRVEFGHCAQGSTNELLFRDYVLAVGSPANVERTAGLPSASRLEGFPLLHVDFYKDDAEAPGWQEWTRRNNLTRTAPERGIRFRRISAALDSVLADAGFALSGVALLRPLLEERRLALPYPAAMGTWTAGAFSATFAADWKRRAPLRAFREWLLAEAGATRAWLEALALAPEAQA
jgi:LysR family glycine cleavage system transcriptional activator